MLLTTTFIFLASFIAGILIAKLFGFGSDCDVPDKFTRKLTDRNKWLGYRGVHLTADDDPYLIAMCRGALNDPHSNGIGDA